MTPLGVFFVAAYAASLAYGRRGVLLVLACAVAFNDSAALVIGEATISPFYLGLILYLAVSAIARSLHRDDAPRAKRGILIGFLIFAVVNAILAPQLFHGTGVVAPGIGLDEQVGALNPLEFSLSSFAQLAYLVLNVGFILFNERDRLLAQRHIAIGLGIGVLIGVWAFAGWRWGVPFAQEIFDNNPRGQYVVNPSRLRAQFSEASHLGGFTVAAVAFFCTRMLQARSIGGAIVSLLFASTAMLLLVSTVSGTATLGAMAAAGTLALIGFILLLTRGADRIRILPVTLLGALALVVVVAFVAAPIFDAVLAIIESKQGGTSLETRTYVDSHALSLTVDTWGIGVGLGNNRSSSMALMLLSTIGVVGALMFAVILIRSVRNGLLDASRRATAIALVAFVAAASVSLADFVSPIMWLAIALCYAPASSREPRATNANFRHDDARSGGPLEHTASSSPPARSE